MARALRQAKILGDGIPATSFAAGSNPVDGENVAGNIDYHQLMPPRWPLSRVEGDERFWRHSDIVKLAFFYVHRIFQKIVAGENQ